MMTTKKITEGIPASRHLNLTHACVFFLNSPQMQPDNV
jgi:hypothetical protein